MANTRFPQHVLQRRKWHAILNELDVLHKWCFLWGPERTITKRHRNLFWKFSSLTNQTQEHRRSSTALFLLLFCFLLWEGEEGSKRDQVLFIEQKLMKKESQRFTHLFISRMLRTGSDAHSRLSVFRVVFLLHDSKCRCCSDEYWVLVFLISDLTGWKEQRRSSGTGRAVMRICRWSPSWRIWCLRGRLLWRNWW